MRLAGLIVGGGFLCAAVGIALDLSYLEQSVVSLLGIFGICLIYPWVREDLKR